MLRKRLLTSFLFQYYKSPSPFIWAHAASVGEVRLAVAFIERCLSLYPHKQFILTVNTLNAMDFAKSIVPATCLLLPCPFDFTFFIKRWLNIFRVEALFLIETELWPNMIALNHVAHGNVFILNGRLSEKSFKKYAYFSPVVKKMLAQVFIFVGDKTSLERFMILGARSEKVAFTGNLKFTLTQKNIGRFGEHELVKKNCLREPQKRLFVAGSVQPEEIYPVLQAYRQLKPLIQNLYLIIIPRHIDKNKAFFTEFNKCGERFHFFDKNNPGTDELGSINFISSQGILTNWYSLVEVVFVGGSLCDRGGQNMIEPLALGAPTCVGYLTPNFKDEVQILKDAGALEVIRDYNEMAFFIREILLSPPKGKQMVLRARKVIQEHGNSMQKTLDLCKPFFEK